MRPWTEPGAAAVMPVPKTMAVTEPGGVNRTIRKAAPEA